MKLTTLITTDNSSIPYIKGLPVELFDEHDASTARLVNIDTKWYLEFLFDDGVARILDIDGQSLSRELSNLKEQVKEHFRLNELTECEMEKTGMKLELIRLSNFRPIIVYVNEQQFLAEACINEPYREISLFRKETHDYYSVYKINDKEPNADEYDLPTESISVYYDSRNRKWD